MRRFSQRNPLVTLSDINVTPLLDLAFNLLIVFIITSPLLEQGLNLNLPKGGASDPKKLNPNNIWAVDVSTNGYYYSKSRWWKLEDLSVYLAYVQRTNVNLLVYVRADETAPYKYVAAILNRLEKAGISQVSLRTEAPK